jgi:hypothetical protein
VKKCDQFNRWLCVVISRLSLFIYLYLCFDSNVQSYNWFVLKLNK